MMTAHGRATASWASGGSFCGSSEVDGGYTGSVLGVGVHPQVDTLAELGANVKEAGDGYFDETMEAPKVIRLHFGCDEVLAR